MVFIVVLIVVFIVVFIVVLILDALLYLAGDKGGLDRRALSACCRPCVVCKLFMESARTGRRDSVRRILQTFGDRVALVRLLWLNRYCMPCSSSSFSLASSVSTLHGIFHTVLSSCSPLQLEPSELSVFGPSLVAYLSVSVDMKPSHALFNFP